MFLQARPVFPSITQSTRRHIKNVTCQAQVGDKVLPLLRSPADFLLLGPRVAVGVLLSTSQNLEQLPTDLERISSLISDPRPIEEKQNELFLEVEDRIASFIERGLGAENDVITVVSDILPEEVKSALPDELKKVILTPRDIPGSTAYPTDTTPTPWSSGGGRQQPLSTWTISSVDEEDGALQYGASSGYGGGVPANMDEEIVATAETVAASQAAAEVVEIQAAVLSVREYLSAYQANTDPSKENMLKLNLREASQGLSQRLAQCAGVGDSAVNGAIEEARELLSEVENL